MTEKTCICCGLLLEICHYDIGSSGPRNICKECRRAADRTRRRASDGLETTHWELPKQDSAPMHLLFQRTRVPVFGSALVGSI